VCTKLKGHAEYVINGVGLHTLKWQIKGIRCGSGDKLQRIFDATEIISSYHKVLKVYKFEVLFAPTSPSCEGEHIINKPCDWVM